MFGNPIHHVYIADGFIDDAEELIQRCIQRQDILDFQSFCIVWKEMDIGCMYKGRSSGAEVAELSEEVIQIAKHYMLANTSNYEESVAGLFLVYSLLNLQPFHEFAALRLVPEDVPAITRLETIARKDKRHDVLYILASVLIKGSQFHAAARERGMEAPIKKYLDGFKSIDSIRGVRSKGVFCRQNEELDIIRELGSITKHYTEVKKLLLETGPPDRSLQYIKEDLPLELNCSLRKILSGLNDEDEEDNVSDDVQTSPKEDHASRVESIKARAMKGTVNPMKHLMGIDDRKRETKLKQQESGSSDITSKLKTSSPTKPQNSPGKRKTSPKGNNSKKFRANPEASTSNGKNENNAKKDDQYFEKEIFSEENEGMSDEEEEAQVPPNTMNLEIGYLPSLIRTDDAGQIVQIELIDNGNPEEVTKVDVIQLNSLPDLDSIEPVGIEGSVSNQPLEQAKDMATVGELDLSVSNQPLEQAKDMATVGELDLSVSNQTLEQAKEMATVGELDLSVSNQPLEQATEMAIVGELDLTTDDNAKEQKMLKRHMSRKKTHLKSKFKRMGILPVANFQDPA